MEAGDITQHTSRRYNEELEGIRSRVLTMGGAVEDQIDQAMRALVASDGQLAEEVVTADHRINLQEVMLDEECNRILARRQPAAGDLRLVITVLKIITDLERVGDEACKIARMAGHLAQMDRSPHGYHALEHMAARARAMLTDALDAFARMDPRAALEVVHADEEVDREYEAIWRQNITFMMEDPRTIRRMLDIIWCARALERVGDHSRNIAEYVIFLVGGRDVRHISLQEMRDAVERLLPPDRTSPQA